MSSVVQNYKALTHVEHILKRSGNYVGNINLEQGKQWLIGTKSMIYEDCSYSPGLIKIIDEIISNVIDQYKRNAGVTYMNMLITTDNMIIVSNDGDCIPIIRTENTNGLYLPSFVFGVLLTSSNFDDEKGRSWNGTNGYGAKLTNVFSKYFQVKSYDSTQKLLFSQTWRDNMSIVEDPIISKLSKEDDDYSENDYVTISFIPDLIKFDGLTTIDNVHKKIICKKLHEYAAFNNLSIYFQNILIERNTFESYVELYLSESERDSLLFNDRFINTNGKNIVEIIIVVSKGSNKMFSFANSAATKDGGTHANFVLDKILKKIMDSIKNNSIKDTQIKKHLMIFFNCNIINPTYDTQMKGKVTNKITKKQPLYDYDPSDSFIHNIISNSNLIELLQEEINNKLLKEIKKSTSKKTANVNNIKKLSDANDAGTKRSKDCILILTEGDSAKSTVISGFSVTGRDKYGVFPLKGKLLNVRNESILKVINDAEIQDLVSALGLSFTETYEKENDLAKLRYGKVRILTDQDHDGSHIKGLILNLFSTYWPNLLKHKYVEQMITPIIKVRKGKENISFYNLKEFEEWKTNTTNYKKYNIKYFKGLGTSTSEDAAEYFRNEKELVFAFEDTNPDIVDMAFSKRRVEERKEWIEEHLRNKEKNANDVLYKKETLGISNIITTETFINKEFIEFSIVDIIRSIPNIMDGLKPSQRKIVHTCLKHDEYRSFNNIIKVISFAGIVAAETAYHHGDVSLYNTLIGLTQRFVGSNNLSLFLPRAQFGSRIKGGADAANPRYLFTCLNPLTPSIFRDEDRNILTYKMDENFPIEPDFFVPIIPMILVNGSVGIGTGWSTHIPCFSYVDIINELRTMLKTGERSTTKFVPFYKGFKSKIIEISSKTYYTLPLMYSNNKDHSVLIEELPVHYWTDTFETLLKEYANKGIIKSFKQYSVEHHVCFLIYFEEEEFRKHINTENGFHKLFKFLKVIKTSNLVAFNHKGAITKYDNVNDILNEYYHVRLDYYQKRKDYLLNKYKNEIIILKNKAKFIQARCNKLLDLENKPVKEIREILEDKKYDSDPRSEKEIDFEYLLNMTISAFSLENIQIFNKKLNEKLQEYEKLEKCKPHELWLNDLEALVKAFNDIDKKRKMKRQTNQIDDDRINPFVLPSNINKNDFKPIAFYKRDENKNKDNSIKA